MKWIFKETKNHNKLFPILAETQWKNVKMSAQQQ